MSYNAFIKNLEEQISQAKKAVQFGNLHNEGGEGYNHYGSSDTAWNRKNLTLQQNRLLEAREWDLSITKQRRIEWNARIKPIIAGKSRVPAEDVRKLEKSLGFTFETMKRFVELHKADNPAEFA